MRTCIDLLVRRDVADLSHNLFSASISSVYVAIHQLLLFLSITSVISLSTTDTVLYYYTTPLERVHLTALITKGKKGVLIASYLYTSSQR